MTLVERDRESVNVGQNILRNGYFAELKMYLTGLAFNGFLSSYYTMDTTVTG